MSLLRYFAKANVVPTAEETGIGEKPTAEANKRVAEVLERQRLGQSTRKRRATVHSEEARAKIGKYASINGTASASVYDCQCYNQICDHPILQISIN